MRKKAFLYFGILICLLTILAGCGGQEEESGYYDILTETEQLPDARENVDMSELEDYVYLGSQYRQGEILQIWGERKQVRKQGEGGNIYLHRENGDRELLLENVDTNFTWGYKWWIDENNQCYLLNGQEIIRPDMDGGLWMNYDEDETVFEGVIFRQRKEEAYFKDICQLTDGRIVLLDERGGVLRLWETDPDSGRLAELQSFSARDMGIAMAVSAVPDGGALVLLCSNGVWEIDLPSGRAEIRLSFDGTAFALKPKEKDAVTEDFRMLEDGRAEVLWSDGTVETLKLDQVDTEREMIVFRSNGADSWMKERVVEFNQKSSDYYVIIEEPGISDLADFRRQTELEIGTGKGADIIAGSAVTDARSLLEKGAFADLTSFMEASGLKEEDYFPGAFSGWQKGEATYGIRYRAALKQYCIDREVAGRDSIANAEELVDCLLAYEGDTVFGKSSYYSSAYVMRYLMQNSESLWGMVDFEQGTCDFSGELFEKMLEAAKRYGYEEKKEGYKKIFYGVDYYNFYSFCDNGFLLDMGLVPIGNMFDDSGHIEIDSEVLAINNNSDQKEGAWEFLCYLLSEEVQSGFYVEDTQYKWYVYFPVDRNVFEELCEKHMKVINNGEDIDFFDSMDFIHLTGLTEERKTALRTAMEDARAKLFDTEPLIQIILEEAGGFFSGARTIDQVRETAENRVQLYLNEN